MISYQESFDAHHAIFRLFRIRVAVGSDFELFVDHWRIVDFFMLFPFRLERMQLKTEHRSFRPVLRQLASSRPYETQPDDLVLLRRMEVVQYAAANTLVHEGFLGVEQFERGQLSATDKKIPDTIMESVDERNEADAELTKILVALATEYVFGGADGIKKRSGLLEYRYDAA